MKKRLRKLGRLLRKHHNHGNKADMRQAQVLEQARKVLEEYGKVQNAFWVFDPSGVALYNVATLNKVEIPEEICQMLDLHFQDGKSTVFKLLREELC